MYCAHSLSAMLGALSAVKILVLLCTFPASSSTHLADRPTIHSVCGYNAPQQDFSGVAASALATWPGQFQQYTSESALCWQHTVLPLCTAQLQCPPFPLWIFACTVVFFVASAVVVALFVRPTGSEHEDRERLRRFTLNSLRTSQDEAYTSRTAIQTPLALSPEGLICPRTLHRHLPGIDRPWPSGPLSTHGSIMASGKPARERTKAIQLQQNQVPLTTPATQHFATSYRQCAPYQTSLNEPPMLQQQRHLSGSLLPFRAASEGSSAIRRTLMLFEPETAAAVFEPGIASRIAAPEGLYKCSPPSVAVVADEGHSAGAAPLDNLATEDDSHYGTQPSRRRCLTHILESPSAVAFYGGDDGVQSPWCTVGTASPQLALRPHSLPVAEEEGTTALSAGLTPMRTKRAGTGAVEGSSRAGGSGFPSPLPSDSDETRNMYDSGTGISHDMYGSDTGMSLLPCTMSEGGAGRWASYGKMYGASRLVARPSLMSRSQYQQRVQLQMQMQLREMQIQKQRQQLRCQMRLHHSPSSAAAAAATATTSAAACSPANARTSAQSTVLPHCSGWSTFAPTTPHFTAYAATVPYLSQPPPLHQQPQLIKVSAEGALQPLAFSAETLMPTRSASVGRGCFVRQMSLLNVTIPEEFDEGSITVSRGLVGGTRWGIRSN